MKKNRVSSFKVFTIMEVFVGVLGLLLLASNTEAADNPFAPHEAAGGMRNCTDKLEACTLNLNQISTNLETCNSSFNQTGLNLGTCNSNLNEALADMETCRTALSQCEGNQLSGSDTAPVAMTGQTTSYVAGDDGDLEAGIAFPTPRFIDSGDGTVTDNLTGLTWMKNAGSIGSRYWGSALQICNALAHGYQGLTDGSYAGDWRLPNVRELYSLIDLGRYNYALPNGHPFINVLSNYWTSTTYAGNTGSAFYINSNNGLVSYAGKVNTNVPVWCVRDSL